jgi:hypothetical protein
MLATVPSQKRIGHRRAHQRVAHLARQPESLSSCDLTLATTAQATSLAKWGRSMDVQESNTVVSFPVFLADRMRTEYCLAHAYASSIVTGTRLAAVA